MPGSYRPTQSLYVLIEPNHYQIMTLIEYLMFQLKQAAFFCDFASAFNYSDT